MFKTTRTHTAGDQHWSNIECVCATQPKHKINQSNLIFETKKKELKIQLKTENCIKPFERFRIINHANSAALPNSKQSNAANPNPINTTFGISAFSNNSAGNTSFPFLKNQNKKNITENKNYA